jgi:short-subunit dehydrogenase
VVVKNGSVSDWGRFIAAISIHFARALPGIVWSIAMNFKPKSVRDQVIVVTGATSGIGLATARFAAQRGARLVLAARGEDALRTLADELNAGPAVQTSIGSKSARSRIQIGESYASDDVPNGGEIPEPSQTTRGGISLAGGTRQTDAIAAQSSPGGRAVAVVADVANRNDVEKIADAAIASFGGFDTWVNNAAVAIYGRLDQVSIEDQRRLFDVDYWGVVHGSLTAVRHFRHRFAEDGRGGGTLINIGSVVSDRAIPLQGPYSAAKHAVKAFTDTLRMELEEKGLPINITLIKPTSIDTPYTHHAKNYMENEPSFPPPVYSPEVVARTILHCAEHPKRDVYVGGGAKLIALAGRYAPRLTDKFMQRGMVSAQQKMDRRAPKRDAHNLDHPIDDLQERGDFEGHVFESSLYSQATLHPMVTMLTLLGAGLTIGAMWKLASSRKGASSHFGESRFENL